MRVIVAGQFERIGLVARGYQRECGIGLQRSPQIAQFAVHPRRECRLGQPRPDGSRNIGRRSPARNFAHGAIGKGDLEHIGHARVYARAGGRGQDAGKTRA